MKSSHRVTLAGLLLFAAMGVVGLILTSDSGRVQRPGKNRPALNTDSGLVNQQFLNTARRLSTLATTTEEQQRAQEALRIADRELNLQFAIALQATAHAPAPQTPEVLAIQKRIERRSTAIQRKEEAVQKLTDAVKRARKKQRDSVQQQLDISQAQLNLHKEALADAKEDLIRAGGDPHSKVQQLIEEHEAASRAVDSLKSDTPGSPAETRSSGSLVAKCSKWNALRQKRNEILQAQREAQSAAGTVTKERDALGQKVQNEPGQQNGVATKDIRPPSPSNPASLKDVETSGQGAAAVEIKSLKRFSEERRALAMLSRRGRNLQQLGSVYGEWAALIQAEQRAVVHRLIASVFGIVLLLLLAFLINRLTEHFFARLILENKQRATLQAVIRITVEVTAALVILMVIFGRPSQMSTIVGLATAGLTVALKDIVVSFLGWFVLMGRHGVRVGDWVEINGVRGEVIEIGLLRTILLETGNWTDAGQPTGRQVAFLNQYAIDGHFFNFSTSGQWLWDELQVLIPRGQDPYPRIEEIRAIVAKETESSARLAELEWQGVSRRYGVRSFSAEPTINVRPNDNGVVIVVRYVVRAAERTEVRYRLNHALVKLLHKEEELRPPTEIVPAPAAPQ